MQNEEISIEKELRLLTGYLESVKVTLPVALFVLNQVGKEFDNNLTKFENENCIVETHEDKSRTVKIKPEHYKEWKRRSLKTRHFEMGGGMLPRSLFVSMISQYDAFLGRLLRAIFLSKPEMLAGVEKSFTFSEVSAFSSIEEFKEYVIEKEIESVLRKSHADQFKYMEAKFGLPLTKGLDIWPRFI